MSDDSAAPARSPEALAQMLKTALWKLKEPYLAMISVYGDENPYGNFPQICDTRVIFQPDGEELRETLPEPFIAMDADEMMQYDTFWNGQSTVGKTKVIRQLWKAYRETGITYKAMIAVYGKDPVYVNYPQILDKCSISQENGMIAEVSCRPFIAMTSKDVFKHDKYESQELLEVIAEGCKFTPQDNIKLYLEGPGSRIEIGDASIDETGRITMRPGWNNESLANAILGSLPPMSIGFRTNPEEQFKFTLNKSYDRDNTEILREKLTKNPLSMPEIRPESKGVDTQQEIDKESPG